MIVFINASQNRQGNTSRMAKKFIKEPYEQADYKIYQLGQHYADDQFNEVLAKPTLLF